MLLEVGRIDKAHGVRGDVVVSLVTDRLERLEPGAVLTTDQGSLTVVAARPHQQRFIVSFAEIGDREAAAERRGDVLRAEPLDDPDELWVHDLIGRTVVDGHGQVLGAVDAVEANPASDLLVLDTGALVPLTFFVAYGDGATVIVDPPPGLLDLSE